MRRRRTAALRLGTAIESIKTHGLRNSAIGANAASETSSQMLQRHQRHWAAQHIPARQHQGLEDGILRQVVLGYERHLKDGLRAVVEMPFLATVICSWWVSYGVYIDPVDFRQPANYDPSRFPSGRVAMRQLLKILLTAYKFGVALYYQNTRDGAEDAQDDLAPSIQDDGCESSACRSDE